jgi:endonuclease-3
MARLAAEYPDAVCALRHQNPYELLAATILSAQTTDERVNLVTPALFARYPSVEDLAAADVNELEALIHSTGFYRNKAKSLLGMARAVVERHGGCIPSSMSAARRPTSCAAWPWTSRGCPSTPTWGGSAVAWA